MIRPVCGGIGMVWNHGFMIVRDYNICPTCHGIGTIGTRDTITEICNGEARTYVDEGEK